MNFLIGFEFEFGWLPNDQTKTSKRSRLSKTSYFEQYVFQDVKDSLKSYFNKQYKAVSAITDDPSLSFGQNFREGYFGVEVVTKPMAEKDAIVFCREFLTWMKKNPNIITNDTCGLHVNISCTDKTINKKLDYYSILENTPQDEILEQFDRTKNSYCHSTHTRKFSLEVNHRKTKPRRLGFWLKKIHQKYISVTTFEYETFDEDDERFKEIIYFNSPTEAEELIKKAFLKSLIPIDKNIAIVEKKSPSKKRYFEFRMIGNTDYEFRRAEILSCITQFKRALKKSVIS